MKRLRWPMLDENLRGLVRRAAAIETAPPGARARVLARVEAIEGSSGGEGDGQAGAPGSAARPSIEPRSPVGGRALAAAAGFAVGGAAGALVMYRMVHAPAPVQVAHITSIVQVASTDNVEALPAEPATANAQPLEPATSAARERPVPPAPASSRTPSALAGASDRIADERRLLDAARGAIEREDGAGALAATAEHARKYPSGVFVQESEAIAVRALVLVGRTEEARARVDRFRERFPDSLLLPALESSVGSAPAP